MLNATRRRLKNLVAFVFLPALLLLIAAPLLMAQAAPASQPVDPFTLLGPMLAAFKNGNAAVGVGMAITLFITLVRKFWSSLPAKWVPELAIACAVASSVGTALAYPQAGVPVGAAVVKGLGAGLAAVGFWQWLESKFPKVTLALEQWAGLKLPS